MLGERHYCLLDGHCTMHVLTTVPCADRPPIRVCPQALSFANAGHRQLALVLRTRHHRRIITATRPRLSPLQPAQWPLSAGVISISRPRGRPPILLLLSPALRKWPRWTPGRAGVSAARTRPDKSSPDGDVGRRRDRGTSGREIAAGSWCHRSARNSLLSPILL